MFIYREESRDPFISAGMNVSVNVANLKLKHGFQWLREQSTVDAVIVNKKASASFLEHLVFKYDSVFETNYMFVTVLLATKTIFYNTT